MHKGKTSKTSNYANTHIYTQMYIPNNLCGIVA